MPGSIVGIITRLTGVPAGLWVERIVECGRLRDQVRQVTADITTTLAPVPAEPNRKIITGGYFTVRNNSE